jgi:hypothetical protein
MQQGQFTRVVRRGWIDGLCTEGLPAAEAFAACVAVAGMPAYQQAYPGPGLSHCVLTQRVFESREGDPDKVDVILIYESWSGMRPVTFILHRETSMVDVVTEIDPASGRPIVTTWVDPNNAGTIIARVGQIRYRQSFQRLVAEGVYYDTPPADMINALGTVNDATWRGLPKGYWYYARQSDVTRDFGQRYYITLELESWLTKDWSEYNVLRNPQGIYAHVDPGMATLLRGQPYQFGMRNINGMTRTGPYPLASFGSIFGFGGL